MKITTLKKIITNKKRSVVSYLSHLKKTLQKRKIGITITVLAVATFFFLVAAMLFFAPSFFTPVKLDATVSIISPAENLPFIKNELQFEVVASIEKGNPKQKYLLQTVLNDVTLDEKELLFVDTNQEMFSISLNTEQLKEGDINFQLFIKNEDSEQLWYHQQQFVKDTVSPSIASQVTTTGSSSTVTIATQSGLIKITDTKAVATDITLQFSEMGTLEVQTSDEFELSWSNEQTLTPIIWIPEKQPPFSTSYTFTDNSGKTTSGEIEYYYDNKPPTFKIISPTNTNNEWGASYAFTFKPSEAVKDLTVSLRGENLPLHKNTFGDDVAKTSLEIGENVFTISATDLNGNRGSQTVVVTVTDSPNKVSLPTTSSSFRPCTQSIRNECSEQVGYAPGAECGLWRKYVDCLKPRCDSRSTHNICGNSWE